MVHHSHQLHLSATGKPGGLGKSESLIESESINDFLPPKIQKNLVQMFAGHKKSQRSSQQTFSQQKHLKPSSQIENVSNFPEIRSLSIVKVGTQQPTPSVSCPERVNAAGVVPRRSKRRKLFHAQKKSNPKDVQVDHSM
jgi:hypothetical protein